MQLRPRLSAAVGPSAAQTAPRPFGAAASIRASGARCAAASSAAGSAAGAHAPDVDVAIAGAGPAGLACAAALRRADPSLRVMLFEKTRMTGRGAAILVGVNGLKALQVMTRYFRWEREQQAACTLPWPRAWGTSGA